VLPFFPWVSRRRRTSLAFADRPQYLLYLVGEERPVELMSEFDEELHQQT